MGKVQLLFLLDLCVGVGVGVYICMNVYIYIYTHIFIKITLYDLCIYGASPLLRGKESAAMQKTQVQSLGQKDSLEKE